MYFYTLLIDRVRRETLMYVVFIGYTLIYFMCAYFFLNPIMGSHHILGWIFYVIMDLDGPLIVATRWSFINAINTPASASRGYVFIGVIVRLGGLVAAESSYQGLHTLSDPLVGLPLILVVAGLLLLLASAFTFCLTAFVPAKYLEGYQPEMQAQREAAEHKHKISEVRPISFFDKIINGLKKAFEGLRLLISTPYVFGIFGIVYCSSIISAILRYQVQFMKILETNNSLTYSGISLLRSNVLFQLVGLFLTVFALAPLLKKYGVRWCLMVTPVITMVLIMSLFIHHSAFFIKTINTIIGGIEFGFNVGLREMLYIPTSHDIKYKARVWIEFSARSFSQTSGAVVALASPYAATLAMTLGTFFSLSVAIIWLILAFLVGRKYEQAVKNNKVIGRNA